ncbi:Lipase (class 3) [Bacillus sp. THAF10]|uniref:lipase family protein n=1 Tax=Bacillus sp. THAF10 TaxID=2587848 RepID=UPI0012A96AA3|nr:lipase family protein [Bacillus sp. THAF10]QFT90322.1 Lipase (class 3) [Bacillus sp. THAF10]
MVQDILSKDWAVFLAHCCQLAYDQLLQNGIFYPPKGFELVKEFKGISFHTQEWFGFIIESSDAIVISFRGTQTDPDWIADAEIYQENFPYCHSPALVHSGFLSVYESMREELMTSLQERDNLKTLFVTGHSLGGALATLFAVDASINLNFKTICMYNYGSPRVGDKAFAKLYNDNVPLSIRFVNLADLVPFVPPRKVVGPFSKKTWLYSHTENQSIFLIREGSIVKNHSMETYLRAMKEKL